MPSFTVTEPHPTVATNSFMHSGRGGAGNFFRAPVTTDPAGVPTAPSAAKKTSSGSSYYFAGRGGAGNAQSASRSPLNFEDEYTSASHASASAGHVGRGGAGNFHAEGAVKKSHRKSSDASSGSSTRSSGFLARLSGTFTR
jgi:hypothetical protein